MNIGLLGPGELRFDANGEAFKTLEFSMNVEELPEYITGIRAPLSIDAEMSFEMDLNVPAFMKMTGIDIANSTDATAATLVCRSPYQVQRRRHKKKRINKKWAKRYGYMTKFREYRLEDVGIRQKDDMLEFVGGGFSWLL